MSNQTPPPSENDKTVTIFVVHTGNDNNDEDDDGELFPPEEEKDKEKNNPSTRKTRSKKVVVPKVPVSKKFKIVRGNPITNLACLITALEHPKASAEQKELVDSLKELSNMIGMESLKEQIVDQILFFIQDLQEPGMFLHTVLTGPPGSGKTTVCNILAKIYSKMGILEHSRVVRADRSDLIGKWLGSTAIKTKEVLESAKGCVLLLDEVYSLGNKDQGDSFSKECIDTLNQYLSEHVDDFICVIAGYKDKVDECFFSYNPGLKRRFPWRFNIDSYKVEDLHKIMELQLVQSGWKLDESVKGEFIERMIKENKDHFKGNGGDTRNLIDKCKMAHARRIFTLEVPQTNKRQRRHKDDEHVPAPCQKILSKTDIIAGFSSFVVSKAVDEKKEEINHSMYM